MAKKMLIVDDDQLILSFLAQIGKNCGYQVDVADSGQSLAMRLVKSRPDFIILDVVMPKFDGVEVLRDLANLQIEARILLVSGYDPDLLQRAQSLGRAWQLNVVGTMQKPLDADEVSACLTAAASEPLIQAKWKPSAQAT